MVRFWLGILIVAFSGTALFGQVSNVDFATQVYPIFTAAGCLPNCHGSSGGLTIGSPAATAYSNIVSQPSSQSINYIEPGNPSASYIYMKITGAAGISGLRMPRDNASYFDNNANELELIRVWIEEGALANATVIAIDESRDNLSASFSLSQNYPNPFNPSTEISYDLTAPASVSLTIFDLLAREVYRAEHHLLPAGSHTITWYATDHTGAKVPSGIYLYRITVVPTDGSPPIVDTRKMAYLK